PPAALMDSARDRPAELDRVIFRCLEKSPSHRLQSARDLAAVLKDIARQAGSRDTGKQSHVETGKHQETAPTRIAPSVAVLPFVNMSSDPENEYFSDGLAEELITALTKLEGLHVASRTSAFAFKGKNEDSRRIGEQLGVRTVLEGSVRKSG